MPTLTCFVSDLLDSSKVIVLVPSPFYKGEIEA